MTFSEALTRRHVPHRAGSGDRSKISLCCPFCQERGKPADTKFRLCVHATQLWGRCLHCDWKRKTGAVFAVLKQLGLPIREAQEVIGAGRPEAKDEERVVLPLDFQLLTHACDDLDLRARSYLLERGVTPEQIARHKLGVSYVGRYAYRIVFPVYADGVLCGINARDFTGRAKAKYLTSKTDKRIWGFDPEASTVVLSEGCFKALRLEQATDACSAALLGHDLTPRQLLQIQESCCERITIYPDVDAVGKKGAATVAERLIGEWRGKVRVACQVYQPADEAPLEDLRAALLSASEYSWGTRQKLLEPAR